MDLPDFVFACAVTPGLILRAQAGTLPRESYYAAWEALTRPEEYFPCEELEEWMRANWPALISMATSQVGFIADRNLESLNLARGWPRFWMADLISAYAKARGVMTEACKAVNKSDETVRLWRLRRLPRRQIALDQLLASRRPVAPERDQDSSATDV